MVELTQKELMSGKDEIDLLIKDAKAAVSKIEHAAVLACKRGDSAGTVEDQYEAYDARDTLSLMAADGYTAIASLTSMRSRGGSLKIENTRAGGT